MEQVAQAAETPVAKPSPAGEEAEQIAVHVARGGGEVPGRVLPTRVPRLKPTVLPPRTTLASAETGPGVPWNYVAFGVMVVALLAVLGTIMYRRRPQEP